MPNVTILTMINDQHYSTEVVIIATSCLQNWGFFFCNVLSFEIKNVQQVNISVCGRNKYGGTEEQKENYFALFSFQTNQGHGG